jgi:PPOX class probable F420-dependent enzyme
MGVELDQDEAWEYLANGHTAIITVNRDDGWPMALPAWLVVEDRKIYVRKAASSATVRRIRKDPRVCVTVESGLAWADLKAVVLLGHADIVDDVETLARAETLIAEKYREFRRNVDAPEAVSAHYERRNVVVRIAASPPLVTWDNHKIRPR